MLRFKPGSSGRAAGHLNPQTISQVPVILISTVITKQESCVVTFTGEDSYIGLSWHCTALDLGNEKVWQEEQRRTSDWYILSSRNINILTPDMHRLELSSITSKIWMLKQHFINCRSLHTMNYESKVLICVKFTSLANCEQRWRTNFRFHFLLFITNPFC